MAAPARWRFVTSATDGQRFEIVPGHNVWDYKWKSVMRDTPAAPTGDAFKDMSSKYERAQVIDPHYGRTREFQIYEITVKGRIVRFAAGEFSNTIFGFYLPEEGDA